VAEYYVSIVGWPVEAESPEEAAKSFYRMLLDAHHAGGMSPILQVTNGEVDLDVSKPLFYGGGAPPMESWIYDTEKWWEEFTNV